MLPCGLIVLQSQNVLSETCLCSFWDQPIVWKQTERKYTHFMRWKYEIHKQARSGLQFYCLQVQIISTCGEVCEHAFMSQSMYRQLCVFFSMALWKVLRFLALMRFRCSFSLSRWSLLLWFLRTNSIFECLFNGHLHNFGANCMWILLQGLETKILNDHDLAKMNGFNSHTWKQSNV